MRVTRGICGVAGTVLLAALGLLAGQHGAAAGTGVQRAAAQRAGAGDGGAACAGRLPAVRPAGQAWTAGQTWTAGELRSAVPLSQAAIARVVVARGAGVPARDNARVRAAGDALAEAAGGAAVRATCVPIAGQPSSEPAEPPSGAAGAVPPGKFVTTGYRTVGKFFFKVLDVPFNCTATVIDDPGKDAGQDLVLTAGHCFIGKLDGFTYQTDDWEFAPGWYHDKDPYGLWQVQVAYYPKRYYHCSGGTCSFDDAYDYAVFVVKPQHGHGVGAVTGEDGWRVSMPKPERVTIAGVPGNSGETEITTVSSVTVTTDGYLSRKADTPAFGNGTSGGPWFYRYDTRTQLGDVLGDTGGYEAGGPSSGSPTYSPYWTPYFSGFVAAAAAGT
jgi:hypothetical protein